MMKGLRRLQRWDVIGQQRKVTFGDGGKHWVQCETDEVSLCVRIVRGGMHCVLCDL